MRRLIAVCLLLLGAISGAVTVGVSHAWAHAQLLSTDPPSGAHLATPPTKITLTFAEGVSLVDHGIRLLGKDAAKQAIGDPRESGTTVTVPIAGRLADGAYVLIYRVVSADTHPVAGSVSFTVGAASAADAQ